MAETKVSVLIPSWNGRAHLEICLPALRRQEGTRFEWEVLVLDNGSDDGSADWIRANHPWVRLIESGDNLGFCAANNRLVAEAEGELVAFLNNDTRPEPEWLATFVDALLSAPDDVAAAAGKILDWDGSRLDFGRGILVFDGHAFQLDYHRPLAEARIPQAGEELPFACAGNMLVRRQSFLGAGGFDERYFAYLEDVDLGWRLWAGGERVLFTPEAVVHHRSGATGARLGNARRGALIERNAFWTAYKNYDQELLPKILPAILLTLHHRERALTSGHESQGIPSDAAAETESLLARVRRHGARESARLALDRLRRIISRSPSAPNEQAEAQAEAIRQIIAGVDDATARRQQVQARRTRPDLEYFERFPVYLVPTYPGDEALFASDAFRSLWPKQLPHRRAAIDEVMALDR